MNESPASGAAPSHWLVERLSGYGDKPFLNMREGSHTYADLAGALTLQRDRLRREGIGPGEIVALLSDYSFQAIALFLALIENRNILVPISSTVAAEVDERLATLPVDRIYRNAEPDALAEKPAPHAGGVHVLLQRLRTEGRAGLVLFSSGSTGKPKAMVHDLDRLVDTYRERKSRDLTLMVFLMFDHIGGLNTLLTALAAGARLVIPESRDPEAVCELIARHRVAVLPASPTFLNLILISEAWKRHDLGSLRIISYGTEPMPESLLSRLRGVFSKVRFVQTFGTSETGISQTTSLSSSSTLLKLDDPNIEHRIVDGELWLRSRIQILGYLNHTMDAFTPDGWFRTGDYVETAENGFIRIRGRKEELINVGGQKVLPAEVESVMLEMPEIEDCVVFGEASPITGQIVCAKVVLRPGVNPLDIRAAVRLFCRARIEPYKIPVKVTVSSQALFGARFKKLRRDVQPDRA